MIKKMVKLMGVGALLSLAACGGDSSDSLFDEDIDATALEWQEGVFLDKDVFENRCENPRSGLDPFNNNEPYPDRQGSVAQENFFLRSWTNELYLWYDEVIDQDPNLFSTADYFDELKTGELTPSGRPKDNFHFTQDTFEYRNSTVAGVTFGYGIELAVGSSRPPREFRVADVIPGSPAALGGVQRGMLITTVDGADLINGNDVDTLNAGLFPSEVGEEHVFVMQPFGSDENQEFRLNSASVESVPVRYVDTVSTATGDVGYMHFDAHIAPSERDLYDAFTTLSTAGVTDLVLDLRYNGGGLLAIASQVAYMITGSVNAGSSTFYALRFNDQHPDRDPVTGNPLVPLPFIDVSIGFADDLPEDQSLPSLNLNRVFVLTTDGTCSASEAIINGLRGVDIEVIQIGETTCGKPYGFYPRDNCGTTYFSVQFTGVNDEDFGEYPDGFSPANEAGGIGIPLPGCWVADDFSRALGDSQEALFAAALQYRQDQSCPAGAGAQAAEARLPLQQKSLGEGRELLPPQQPGLNNAILLPPR